jgi:hypothetical protein
MAESKGNRLFVSVPVEDIRVRSKDIVFFVYRGRQPAKFGELRVSQGALVWRGPFDQYGRKVSWTRFARLMEKVGRKSEKRPPGAAKSVSRKKRRQA